MTCGEPTIVESTMTTPVHFSCALTISHTMIDSRRDRGEQLLDKIRGRSLNLHNMLSVEDAAHGTIEDFTQNIVGMAKSLRADIAREKDARVVTEGRHAQRIETLRELASDLADDRKKRARKREQMFIKIKEEYGDVLKYIQAETQVWLRIS